MNPSASRQARVLLARRILEHELAGRSEPLLVATAVEGAVRRLHAELDRLIGTLGLLALLQRAVHEARRDYRWMERIELQVGRVVALPGLDACVAREGLAAVVEGCSVLLANVLGLLVAFIGEDLTMRLLRRCWPEVLGKAEAPGGPGAGPAP